jgi:tRNA uridine 5-carboxymethylaminomethyl modification enzyme
LAALSLTPSAAARHGLALNRDGLRRNALQLLAFPSVTFATLQGIWPELSHLAPSVIERLETDATYSVYLDRQAADIAAFRRDEAMALADDLDFDNLAGISAEITTKLRAVRPRTLGQAARIEGVTPAAITLLTAYARRQPRAPAFGSDE